MYSSSPLPHPPIVVVQLLPGLDAAVGKDGHTVVPVHHQHLGGQEQAAAAAAAIQQEQAAAQYLGRSRQQQHLGRSRQHQQPGKLSSIFC